jgi:hypothetical protein
MDLQKLRPTPTILARVSIEEARARKRLLPVRASLHAPPPPPKGKGGELWQKFYNNARASGHPDPEKMADSLLRARERSLDFVQSLHTTKVTTDLPKPQETAVMVAPKRGRLLPTEANRCKAKTLAGKQCPFKASCGEFCSKHQVVNKI